jgi:anti-sigma factor RsiW
MNWNCQQIEERLSEHLDGLLDATERAAFESHVAECAQCHALVTQVSGALAQVHRLEMVEEPLGLTTAILDQTLGPRAPKKSWRGGLGWLQPVWQPRMAMGFATVVLFGVVTLQTMGVQVNEIKLSDLHPVKLYQESTRRAHLMYARGEKFVSDLRVVYEIQSRLRPAQEEPPPPQQPAPKANPQDKPNRESNRLNDPECRLCVVTTGLGSVPGRSW